jgi:uncharacterized protein
MQPRRALATMVLCATLMAFWPASSDAAPSGAPSQHNSELQAAVARYERGDHAAAQAAFEALGNKAVPAAWYNLAVMHLKKQIGTADDATAFALMQRAAQAGFVTAMYGLGQLHERGQGNGAANPDGQARRNLPEAMRWYKAAAEGGSVDAAVEMGTGHYLGRGVAKDPKAAAHWYFQAAKTGDVGAMYLLASMYESGEGVAQDLRAARLWYALAAAGGDVAAPGKVKDVDAKIAAQAETKLAP